MKPGLQMVVWLLEVKEGDCMKVSTWSDLINCLWDRTHTHNEPLPGLNLEDWLGFVQHDYDEVDVFYTEHETIGG